MDRASLKAHAKEQIKGKIFTLLAISLIISIGSGLLGVVPGVGAIAGILIAGPLAFAMTYIYVGISRVSRMPKIEDIIVGFKGDNFLRTLVAYLRLVIFTFLWSLLFWIPGIIKGISYSQMFFLLADDDKLEPGDAQRKSMEIMEGHKWEYFVLQLSFIPWFLLCGITFGLAAIYVVPYVETTNAAFYDKLIGKTTKKEEAKKASVKKPATKKSTKK